MKNTRIDVDFYHPEFRALIAKIKSLPKTATVNEILRLPLVSGFAAGKANRAEENDASVPQIRPTQILPMGELDLSEAYGIRKLDIPKADYIQDGEVLFNNTNSTVWVGKSAVFRGLGSAVCSNHVTRLRLRKDIDPDFVTEVFNLLRGRGYFGRLCTNFNNQAGVNSHALAAVRLPMPGKAEQDTLVKAMGAARAERREKREQADALLASLDDYVLNILGIARPALSRKFFAVRHGDSIKRLDPDFHSPHFVAIRAAIEAGKYSAHAIEEICTRIKSGFAAGRQAQAFDDETGVPHLRPLNMNTYGELSIARTKRVPSTAVAAEDWCVRGEVLFNNTNSTEMVGKSAVFDLEVACAYSNHMTRLLPREGIDAEFLASVLNALRSTGYFGLLSTNFNNQAGINTETLRRLRIPVPEEALQKEIATEVRRRRAEARRLRAEAEAGWQAARQWFEDQLLAPAP